MKHYLRYLLLISFGLVLFACDNEHKGYTPVEFTGEYRFYKNIAEFFDCEQGINYFVAKHGIYETLQTAYLKLPLKGNDDVYIKVEGYLRQEQLMQEIDAVDVFVATKLHIIDPLRGCKKNKRMGR